jgi:hypothetical protein
MNHAVPPICLKMARVEMAEILSSHPGFFVMGDNLDGTGMIVYTRSPIRGLPAEYKTWSVIQVPIQSVRHDEREQDEYERRVGLR